MAFVAYSEDFDLDDDGILRDSTESEEEHWTDFVLENKPGCILIDDDGIVRDDIDILSKHGSSTHWTDSGLGVDKPSSTPSTLRQMDLQSYPSFEDVSRNLDDSHVNISDFEASRDEISFDEGDKDFLGENNKSREFSKGNRSGLSSRSSFDHSLNYDDTLDNTRDEKHKEDLFSEEYYRQLQELGVLVDEEDFIKPRDSLQEFENLEHHYSRDYEDEGSRVDDAIEEFLRNDANTTTKDSMDLAKPDFNDDKRSYFGESHGFDHFDQRDFEGNDGGKRTRPNTASSTRTISSRSFPEISPEEALELYTARLQTMDDQTENSSIQFEQSQSQRLTQASDIDDDEIFFVASQDRDDESPKPPKMPAYDNEDRPSHTLKSKGSRDRLDRSSDRSRSVTPQGYGHSQIEEDLEDSRSLTPRPGEDLERHENLSRNGYQSNDDRADSLTQVTRLDSRNKTYSDSDTFRPESALSELSSAASESRSARPKNVSNTPTKRQHKEQQKGTLSHARSQESFFDMQDGSPKKGEKGPKRLLPKPSSNEGNQSFKVKSKSVTNIAALGPVKPTHMSLSEIHNINIDEPDQEIQEQSEPKSTTSDVPKGELSQKLKQEASKRQQATQLVKQLQSDYDKLLSKYALAELTIDQMRLGAKISLHANSPTPSQATSGSIQSAQHLHMLQLASAQQAQIAPSPQQSTPNLFFPENVTTATVATGQDSNDGRMPRGMSPAILPRSDSTNSMDSTSTPRGDVEEQGGIANEAERVKLGLLFQARNLDEKMQSFQTLLGEEQLTVQEQENVFEKIRTDHEKLRRDYLQSKEDYNVLKRSSAAIGSEVNFDQEKELEGELFKLGMKFDEIHEKVEENMKEKSSKRQPFQDKRKDSVSSTPSSAAAELDPSTENMKKKLQVVKAGDDLLHPKFETSFEDKLKKLHEEYNALMDRYRRLKQMAQTRERDREIDQLVKKLKKICNEEPDVFRLPPELQDRVDQVNATIEAKMESTPYTGAGVIDKHKSTSTEKRKLPSPKKASKSPAKSYEIMSALSGSESWSLAESIDRWERSKVVDQDDSQRPHSRENLDISVTSTRSFRNEEENGARERDHYGEGSSLQKKDRTGSYSSLSSRGRHTPDSMYNDRGSPVPSLPRPRRHDFPERERRERRSDNSDLKKTPEGLKESTSSLATDSGFASLYSPKRRFKRPDAGSTTSLQDSGISEHEGGATGTSGPNSPLSKLPGPGKFKQMTGRREPDTDSGFIGSMVGSEVSAGNLSSRRQPPQSPLRLRHPGDLPANQQRPSSRQSTRSEDSARATTPRSARSVASSKSSRRTPTKAFPLPETNQSKSATETRSKTPTRPESKSKKHRDQASSARDYTDESYTTVTENELSFDSDMHSRPNRGGSRNRERQIEKIAEDSEEEQYTVDPSLNETTDLNLSWISESSRSERPTIQEKRRKDLVPSSASKTQQRPSSGSKTKQSNTSHIQNQGQVKSKQGRSSRQISEDESSLSVSPTRDTTREMSHNFTRDTTQDTYTSDETTPRSVIERQRKSGRDKPSPRVTELKAPKSPSPETAPPRSITPIKVQRSEVHPKLLHQQPQRGPLLKAPEPTRSEQEVFVNKEIGSGSEDTILASDAETAATRGSVNSQRLKLLTDEIGKLKEEFYKANQEKQQQPQPAPPQPPAQPPQDQYYDQYFDPTEDPLAFMRGPRRRANSFSGRGERQYEYDWMYPSNRDGDIPLGYAAAESYATPRKSGRHKEEPEGGSESQGRRRLRQRIKQRNTGTQHFPEQNGYDSDQSPTRGHVDEMQPQSARLQGHFGYYSPQNVEMPDTVHSQGQTIPPPGYQAVTQSGRRVYGSQPNLKFSGYQPPPPPRSVVSGHSTRSSSGTHSQSGPLRQTLYSYAANPHRNRPHSVHGDMVPEHLHQRPYANDDININEGRTRFIPNGATDVYSDAGVRSDYGVYTDTCPMCGSTSYHTHGEFVYPPQDHRVPVGFLVHDGRDLLENITVPVYALTSAQVASHLTQVMVPAALPVQMAPQVQPLFDTEAGYQPNNCTPEVHFQSPPSRPSSASPALAPLPALWVPQLHSQFNVSESQPNNQTPHVYFQPPPLPPTPPPPPPKGYPHEKSGQSQSKSSISRSSKPSLSRSHSFKEHKFSRQDPLRASLPVRVYKAPPPIKPQLFPVNMPLTPRPIQRAHSFKHEPMTSLPDGVHQPIIIESPDKEGGPGVRGRSRSSGRMGRIRHYSPDGRVRSRYFVRQFGGDESESAESDVEEAPRRRSRSVGRRRKLKSGRKYRRVRGEGYENEAPTLTTTESQPKAQEIKHEDKGENPEKKDSATAEEDLNRSLRLCGEIDELTHKMINTVSQELKSQRRKEFGSSVW